MGTLSFCPVGVRTPVAASILKTTSESEFWFAAMSQLPSGEMPKLRGGVGVAAQVAGWSMAASCALGVISLVRRDAQFQTFSLLVLLVPALPALGVYFVMRALGA